jgi:integrase
MDSCDEISEVLEHAPSLEARAVFALGLYGGLRPAEARAVVVSDVELTYSGRSYVRVRKGKWSKPRRVGLPRQGRDLILPACVGKEPGDRVYPFNRTEHARDLDSACREAKTRYYGPHDLRRTFAAQMLAAGTQLEDRQDQLGHADPKTPRGYDGPARTDRAVQLFEKYLGA